MSRLYLDTPVTYLKGVGPMRAEALRRLGVVTAGDLLYHVPHRYEDASTVSPIATLEPGMQGTVIGRVISKGVIPTLFRIGTIGFGLDVYHAGMVVAGLPVPRIAGWMAAILGDLVWFALLLVTSMVTATVTSDDRVIAIVMVVVMIVVPQIAKRYIPALRDPPRAPAPARATAVAPVALAGPTFVAAPAVALPPAPALAIAPATRAPSAIANTGTRSRSRRSRRRR